MLPADGVEHGLDDAFHKPLLLVVVDLHHLRGAARGRVIWARGVQIVVMGLGFVM